MVLARPPSQLGHGNQRGGGGRDRHAPREHQPYESAGGPEPLHASAGSTWIRVQFGSRLERLRWKVQTSAVRRSSTASPSGPFERLRNSARNRTAALAKSPLTPTL